MVGWVGFEPTTNGLKGRCSTAELPTLIRLAWARLQDDSNSARTGERSSKVAAGWLGRKSVSLRSLVWQGKGLLRSLLGEWLADNRAGVVHGAGWCSTD